MRLDGWEALLNQYLCEVGVFAWGKNDCCMFSVGAVKAMTGVDHGVGYKYTTEIGAAKVLKKAGGVEAIATKCLGEHKSPLLAQRGDVVSFDVGKGLSLGICIGSKIAAIRRDGLIFLPMSQSIKSWSV